MEQLFHDSLPDFIVICLHNKDQDKQFIDTYAPGFKLVKYSNGKPYLIGEQIDVNTVNSQLPSNDILKFSRSHTGDIYLTGINRNGDLGIDIENETRKVDPRIMIRIRHGLETDKIYDHLIRVWSMKEAVLKLLGTGLRTPMNSICINQINETMFKTRLKNHEIDVVSISYRNHWISTAYTS